MFCSQHQDDISPGGPYNHRPLWQDFGLGYDDLSASEQVRGRSSAGRALDWQSRGSWVRVPSPPLETPGQSASGLGFVASEAKMSAIV